jgi:hypothetical protein
MYNCNMKLSLEKKLTGYNENIKDVQEMKKKGKDFDLIETKRTEGLIENQDSFDVDHEEKMYSMQIEKRAIMDRMHQRMELLDKLTGGLEDAEILEKIYPSNEYASRVYFSEKDNLIHDKRVSHAVSIGSVSTDLAWGQKYRLDNKTPRAWHKRYILEEAKLAIQDIADRQIIEEELISSDLDDVKRSGYQNVLDNWESRKKQPGIQAEMMLGNLFKRAIIEGLEKYSIEQGDFYDDMELKADFTVENKEKTRQNRKKMLDKKAHGSLEKEKIGVIVDSDDPMAKKGIQFTLNVDQEQYKENQIKRTKNRILFKESELEDVILVIFDSNEISRAMKLWKNNRRPIGGPEQYLRREALEPILESILKDVAGDDDIQGVTDAVLSCLLKEEPLVIKN